MNFLLFTKIHLQISSLIGLLHSQNLFLAALSIVIHSSFGAERFSLKITVFELLLQTIYLASLVASDLSKPKGSSIKISISFTHFISPYSSMKRSAMLDKVPFFRLYINIRRESSSYQNLTTESCSTFGVFVNSFFYLLLFLFQFYIVRAFYF